MVTKGNKILTKDDKKKLASFLLRCLSDGEDRKKVADQAKVWIKKDGKVSYNDITKDSNLYSIFKHMAYVNASVIMIIILMYMDSVKTDSPYMQPVGTNWKVAVSCFFATPIFAIVATVSEFGIYFMYKHISNKKYARACAEKVVDAYNMEYCKKLESDVQNLQNLINEIFDNRISNGNSCSCLENI